MSAEDTTTPDPAEETASQPWERQPGEPERLYAVFDHYRLMGPLRSVSGAAEAVSGKRKNPSGAAYRASREWKWLERAEAWDAHQREQRHAEMEADRLALRLRLLGLATKGLGEAERRLDRLRSIPNADLEVNEAGVVKLAEWAQALALDCLTVPQLERLRDQVEALMGGKKEPGK